MISNIIFQADNENTLSNKITEAFEQKPKKAYFFCGSLKESGFKIIEDNLIDSNVKSYFAIGIDKKNTTKVMLENILIYTKDVYIFSNNNVNEFLSNIIIFEYADKILLYSLNGSVSENSLSTDYSLYVEIEFNLKDKEESSKVKSEIKNILKIFEKLNFEKLTKTKIEELVESKEIFSTRQYVHNVMSISELLGKKTSESTDNLSKISDNKDSDDEFKPAVEIPKVDLSDIDFDIDIPDEEIKIEKPKNENTTVEEKSPEKENDLDINVDETSNNLNLSKSAIEKLNEAPQIDENNELYDESLNDIDYDENDTLDINSLLFENSGIKLDMSENSDEKLKKDALEDSELVQVKKVNLNNITNYIYELPSKVSKGQDVCNLKIPNYINNMIPSFFELNEKGKNEIVDGVTYKTRKIELEIVDVKNEKKYNDRRAKIYFKAGQTYINFSSDYIRDIDYAESDIARIIKLSDDVYHIEIISKDLQEYNLWSKLCNQNFKSSTRKFGMM